jgi:hypothetical protein
MDGISIFLQATKFFGLIVTAITALMAVIADTKNNVQARNKYIRLLIAGFAISLFAQGFDTVKMVNDARKGAETNRKISEANQATAEKLERLLGGINLLATDQENLLGETEAARKRLDETVELQRGLNASTETILAQQKGLSASTQTVLKQQQSLAAAQSKSSYQIERLANPIEPIQIEYSVSYKMYPGPLASYADRMKTRAQGYKKCGGTLPDTIDFQAYCREEGKVDVIILSGPTESFPQEGLDGPLADKLLTHYVAFFDIYDRNPVSFNKDDLIDSRALFTIDFRHNDYPPQPTVFTDPSNGLNVMMGANLILKYGSNEIELRVVHKNVFSARVSKIKSVSELVEKYCTLRIQTSGADLELLEPKVNTLFIQWGPQLNFQAYFDLSKRTVFADNSWYAVIHQISRQELEQALPP